MRIDSSVIGMESERNYTFRTGSTTRMTITDKKQDLADGTGSLFGNLLEPGEDEAGQAKEKESPGDFVAKTMEEMRSKQALRTRSIRTPEVTKTRKQLASIRQQCLNFLMDMLFLGGRSWQSSYEESDSESAFSYAEEASLQTFTFSNAYYREETEFTAYSTQGTVRCADGREISFNLNLNMSRSFQEYYEENFRSVDAVMCDPLVINLDGNIAELSDQTFFFDIDGDGEMDEINKLAGGSGYLALDKNGDGIINDGTELFGTASGNGFADLAEYDTDGNGFIDEGDEIWSRLKIWTMDEDGNQQLVSLAESGVGAICLQNSATDFALTGQDNQMKGMIRNTGFFLYENGLAGTVQHVDVVKYNHAV